MNACPLCTRPTEVAICGTCMRAFTRRLATVGPVLDQLAITCGHGLTRPDTLGISRRAHPGSLPVDLSASQSATDLAAVLDVWAAEFGAPASAGRESAAWLIAHAVDVAASSQAEQCVDECTDAVRQAWKAVDLPADRTFLGPCPDCGADLYARSGRAQVTCRCGTVTEVSARRDWLLSQVRDQLDTATGIARALPGLVSVPLTPAMIRGYAHRGRLSPRPAGPDGRPRYRVGDVLDLLAAG